MLAEPMTYYMGKMIPKSQYEAVKAGKTPTPAIPRQLADCRMIRVAPKEKRAVDPGWQSSANYAHDDPRIVDHLANGGNYGVMPAGGVCILDADDLTGLGRLGVIEPLLPTYTIRTGRESGGAHIYLRCPDAPTEKIILRDPTTGADLGDFRGSGHPSYVVGPGSLHPSGRRYEPVDPNAEIKSIAWAALKEILDRASKKEPAETSTPPPQSPRAPMPKTTSNESISERLGLRVTDFLMPTGATHRDGEIEGAHPIHGSETGNNLTISADNRWWCRRHQTGGGPLEALAVAEGIIDCADVRRGGLQGHWAEVFAVLRAKGYPVDPPAPAEGDPDPEITVDVEAEALEVLEHGDPLETLRETFATLHSGDREVIDTLAVAVGSQCCVNTQGVQPALTGGKGAGKTSAAKAGIHLFPRESLIEGTFSNKALFYADLKPGMVLFSDDTTLNPDMTDLVKRCMSSFQSVTEYRTVDGKLKPRIYTIPPRTVFLFTSLGDQGDDQLSDRQYKIGVETNDQTDAAYEVFLKQKAIEGAPDYPLSRAVLICRAMIREVKRHLFRVRMPFFRYVSFEDKSNRRIMRYFVDFIAAVAALRFAQRGRGEPDDDGVIPLTATTADMRTAAGLFKSNEDTRKLGLTKEELALWHLIASRGGEIGEDDLIEVCGKDGRRRAGTRTHVRRLLYGRTDRGAEGGGLLGKVPGATVRKETATGTDRDGETVRRQRNLIVIKARPDITLYGGFYLFDEDAWRRDPEYVPEVQ